MVQKIQQQAIFITGAASGIGKETALLFARKGWYVGLFDLNEGKLSEVANEIPSEQRCFQKLDVADYQNFQQAVAFFEQNTGRMDLLFNNAGILRMNRFEACSHQEHAQTVAVNVMGVINGIYAALALLKKTPNARIISMCSASAIYGVPELASYSASKFFVRGLTEALNLELEKEDIWVSDLMPLYVNTPMIQAQQHQAPSLRSMGTKLTPQQIAELVWKAANRKKVHWIPGFSLRLLKWLGEAFPWFSRPILRWINKV